MESGQDSYSAAGSSLEVLLRRPRPDAGARAQQARSPSPMGAVSRPEGDVERGVFTHAPYPPPAGNPAYREAVSVSADASATWVPISTGIGNLGRSASDAWQLRQAPRPPPGLPAPRREVFRELDIGSRYMPDSVGASYFPPRSDEVAPGLDSCGYRDSWNALPGEDVAETWARLEAAGDGNRHRRDAWALQGARPKEVDVPLIQRGRWLREPQAEHGVVGSAAVGGPVSVEPAAGRGPAGSRGHQGPQPHEMQPESRERLSTVTMITEDGEVLQLDLPMRQVQAFRRAATPQPEDVAAWRRQEQSCTAPPLRQEVPTPRRAASESSPLEWDYSDLSGGVTTEDEETERLTRSVRDQATRACAREPEVRAPAGQDLVRGVRPEDRSRGCGTTGTETPVSRPPCPFSPVMVCHGPTQARSQPQDGVPSSHAQHSTASRWVPITVPVTTQATTRTAAAQVTWAQSQPRVAAAVPSMTGRADYGSWPMQVGVPATQYVTRPAGYPQVEQDVSAGFGGARWGMPQRSVTLGRAPVQPRGAVEQDPRVGLGGAHWGLPQGSVTLGRDTVQPSGGSRYVGYGNGAVPLADPVRLVPQGHALGSSPAELASGDSYSPLPAARPKPEPRKVKEASSSARPVTNHFKPEKFDGKSNWRDYRAQFDIVARMNGWDEKAKASHLASSLRGPALEVLGDLPEWDREDYPLLIAALEQRFGNKNQAELHKVQLKTRCKSKNESYQEMAQAIRRLTREAYPRTDASTHETLALDAFLEGISDESIREKVIDRKPLDLESAVLLAVEYEARKRADSLRGKGKHARVAKSESAVGSDGEKSPAGAEKKSRRNKGGSPAKVAAAQVSQDDFVALKKEMAKLAELVAQSQRANSPRSSKPRSHQKSPRSGRGPCYNCQEQGHFAAECPYPRADKRPDGTPIPRAKGTAQQQGN